MSQTFKTVRAVISPQTPTQRFVYALDAENPEQSLAKALRDFMESMGYSAIFPNFDKLRISTIHPFSILLAQDVLDKPASTNLFPSITVGDSTMDEDAEVLGDDYAAFSMTPEEIAVLGGWRVAKKVYVSDVGWAKIMETVNAQGHIVGIKRRYHTAHAMDFNIWSENKDVTSFIFDMVGHFLVQERVNIHNNLGIDLARISGRRSGDINLDFGMLLYGGNLRVQASMNHEAVLFDTGVVNISQIDVKTLPQYFVLDIPIPPLPPEVPPIYSSMMLYGDCQNALGPRLVGEGNYSWGGTAIQLQNTEHVYQGSYAIKLTKGVTEAPYIFQATSGITELHGYVPGKTYRLRMAVYTPTGLLPANTRVQLWAHNGVSWSPLVTAAGTLSDGYEVIDTGDFVLPPGTKATSTQLRLYGTTPGTVWLGDAKAQLKTN